MSVLRVKNGDQWDIVPAIKGDTGDPAADESITDDMLVPDGIKTEIDWLWGNQLMDIREGEILQTDDAYEAPLVSLDVDGKSTQVVTTGKNLFDKDRDNLGYYKYDTGEYTNNTRYRYFRIAVTEGDVVRMSPIASGAMSTYLNGTYVGTPGIGVWAYTIPAGVDEISGYFLDNNWGTGIVTLNNSDLTYEPYTGGKPAPSPDYPQEIVSVNQAGLQFSGRNIFDFNFVDQYELGGGGVRFTANGDGTFTVETIANTGGSKTVGLIKGTGFRHVNINYPIGLPSTVANGAFQLPAGTYTFRSYSSNDETKVYLRIRHGAYSATSDGANNVTFTTDGTEWCQLFLYVQSFATLLANGPVTLRAQLEVNATATDYEPYLGNTVPLLPDGYSLRSLPDGTKDELHLSYLRPSTREGWAVYGVELTQRVAHIADMGEASWTRSSTYRCFYMAANDIRTDSSNEVEVQCNKYIGRISNTITQIRDMPDKSIARRRTYGWICVKDSDYEDATTFRESVVGDTLDYPLATPITTQLDPIELPIMPSKDTTIWSDPATNLKMTYIQDTNLVIESLEATVADMATS